MKEVNSFLTIPKNIVVGYRSSDIMYGFVTYHQGKALAKSKGWESWRDAKIDPREFENKPTLGFVITGITSYYNTGIGLNSKQAYCKIYDPRGFETHVYLENIIELIKTTNCVKGYIEEELLYCWENGDIRLLSTKSPSYISTKKMEEDRMKAGISGKTLVPGLKYEIKDNPSGAYYLGRFPWRIREDWMGEVTKKASFYTFYSKTENKSLILSIDIKNILYPSYPEDKFGDEKLHELIDKFTSLPCGRPDEKIIEFGYIKSDKYQKKAEKILIDKKYTSANGHYYLDNIVEMGFLSDDKRTINVYQYTISDGSKVTRQPSYSLSLKPDSFSTSTLYRSGNEEACNDEELREQYEKGFALNMHEHGYTKVITIKIGESEFLIDGISSYPLVPEIEIE